MPTATITSKGQTTIPREVRTFLKLKPGDKLEFKIDVEKATVILKAANVDLSALRGILKSKGMNAYNPDERKAARRNRVGRK